MTIVVSNLRKPGIEYSSDKLAVLGNMIAGSVKKKSNGRYDAGSTIKGKTITFTFKIRESRTGPGNKQVIIEKNVVRSDQSILAGRISNFLMEHGISSEVKVK